MNETLFELCRPLLIMDGGNLAPDMLKRQIPIA
jgi:hypothetical protein